MFDCYMCSIIYVWLSSNAHFVLLLRSKGSAIYNNNFARPRDRLVSVKNVGLADLRVCLTCDYRRRYTRPAYVFARLNRGISRSGIIPSPGLTAPRRAITSRLCRIQEFQDAFPRCRGTKRSWRTYLVESLRALYLSEENFDVIAECYDKSARCNKSFLFTATGRGLRIVVLNTLLTFYTETISCHRLFFS